MKDKLILHVQDERWAPILTESDILTLLKAVFDFMGFPMEKDVAVVLADDAQIQSLNHDFRGKDAPTNVLSFPAEEEEEAYGDVILAYETVMREAEEQGKAVKAHASHLFVHGVLHLMGYDHLEEDEAEEMESFEKQILASLAIADPYK